MSDISLLPFESAQRIAETLTDSRAKSQLLSELAQRQLSTGQFDAALQTFAAIPSPQERRIALLVSNFQSFPPEKIEPLLQLLKMDSQTNRLAGRLAFSMLEAKNTRSAWKLVETADDVFESEQRQYEFLEKVLPQINADDWEKVLRLYRTFEPGMNKDWASLAIIKYLAGQQRGAETERFIRALSSSLRSAWAYWEIYRLSPAELAEPYFGKALDIVETMEITPNEEETMETLAIMLRIFGRAAVGKGWKDRGERLLEKSEAAAAVLTLPIQRYRLQCFLGKVLMELRQIEAVQNYLPIDEMLASLTAGLNRSRVSVWLAEAGWQEGWQKAVETMAAPERGTDESDRVQQISEVLKRFVAHHQKVGAAGDSKEDSVRVSGEEFETLYFNPFAEWDCGC